MQFVRTDSKTAGSGWTVSRKWGVIGLVVGEVEVGMTRDIDTEFDDDRSPISIINDVKLLRRTFQNVPPCKGATQYLFSHD